MFFNPIEGVSNLRCLPRDALYSVPRFFNYFGLDLAPDPELPGCAKQPVY
jgi:hypothetical protein